LNWLKEVESAALLLEKRAFADHAPRSSTKKTPRKRTRRLVFIMWLFR
jgi:hypothetical protein